MNSSKKNYHNFGFVLVIISMGIMLNLDINFELELVLWLITLIGLVIMYRGWKQLNKNNSGEETNKTGM